MRRCVDTARRVMIKLALLIVIGLVVLYFGAVFVIALIQTIKETRRGGQVASGQDFNAGLGFGGELGVKLIRKPKP